MLYAAPETKVVSIYRLVLVIDDLDHDNVEKYNVWEEKVRVFK
jgi:hypothetical protein